MGNFLNFFVSFDIFGHPVGVNYKGEDTFKTRVGAFCTLAMYVVTFVSLIAMITAFNNNSKMETSTQQSQFDPYEEPAFGFEEYQAELGMMIQTSTTLPPDIGKVSMYQIKGCRKDELAEDSTACKEDGRLVELKSESCSDRKVEEMAAYYVPRYGQDAFDKYILPFFSCFNSRDLQL